MTRVRAYFSTLHPSHLTLVSVALVGFVFIGLVEPAMAGQVLYCILVIMGFTFTMLYARGSEWRITASGRAIMYLIVMFTLFVAWVTVSFWLSRFAGDSFDTARDWVRSILSLGLIVMFVNLIVTLRRFQTSEVVQRELDEQICPLEAQRLADEQRDPS